MKINKVFMTAIALCLTVSMFGCGNTSSDETDYTKSENLEKVTTITEATTSETTTKSTTAESSSEAYTTTTMPAPTKTSELNAGPQYQSPDVQKFVKYPEDNAGFGVHTFNECGTIECSNVKLTVPNGCKYNASEDSTRLNEDYETVSDPFILDTYALQEPYNKYMFENPDASIKDFYDNYYECKDYGFMECDDITEESVNEYLKEATRMSTLTFDQICETDTYKMYSYTSVDSYGDSFTCYVGTLKSDTPKCCFKMDVKTGTKTLEEVKAFLAEINMSPSDIWYIP